MAGNVRAVAAFWKDQNMDAVVKSGLANMRATDLVSTKLNLRLLHAQVKAFHPQVGIEDLLVAAQLLDKSSDELKEQVLAELRSGGYLPFFERGAAGFSSVALALQSGRNLQQVHSLNINLHPRLLNVQDCAGINLAIMAAGLAFLTIGVMASGGVLLLAGWGAVAVWGGGAATVAGVGASIGGC